MNLNVSALVLRVRQVGESDRLCTLLTDKLGVINAFARGAKNIKNKNFSATSQFAYGHYELFSSKDRFIIDESVIEELFVPLRDDIERLALGQYICELACELVPADGESEVFLKLVLFALKHLSDNDRPILLLKAATEMRLLAMAGYMPDLVMCAECGEYENSLFHFYPVQGNLLCDSCHRQKEIKRQEALDKALLTGMPHGERPLPCTSLPAPLSKGALSALRHTIYVDLCKTYSFSLGKNALAELAVAAERYLLSQVEHTFNTLDFLRSIIACQYEK